MSLTAVGLDLGGTKIEVSLFDSHWQAVEKKRVPTPQSYGDLLRAIVELVEWADDLSGQKLPIGLGAAGILSRESGLLLAANHAATGMPLLSDLETRVGRRVLFINDSHALALSEAVFGSGNGYSRVAGIVLGTGVGGGFVVDGRLAAGESGVIGEVGHIALPAHLVTAHDLPVLCCGCGRTGCYETLISGPGLERLAKHLTNRAVDTVNVVEGRHGEFLDVWDIWCALVAELIQTMSLTFDPDAVVLGGGLSEIPEIVPDIEAALRSISLDGFRLPKLLVAEGGAASGGRGAAYAAWLENGCA